MFRTTKGSSSGRLVHAGLWYFFFMHLHKHSGLHQNVFDTHDIDHKTACTSLPEDEHLVV